MEEFVTSDTHFWHTRIIEYSKRPFANRDEMNEVMVNNWNGVVKPGDSVRHLGDFSFGLAKDWRNIRRRLNGEIHLIKGNHDQEEDRDGEKIPYEIFASVKDYDVIKVNGQSLVLFHYGMRTWWHDLKGVWHCYGHSHTKLSPYGKSCDVGVDNSYAISGRAFTPIHFDELKKFMDKRAIGDHPQFENYKMENNI